MNFRRKGKVRLLVPHPPSLATPEALNQTLCTRVLTTDIPAQWAEETEVSKGCGAKAGAGLPQPEMPGRLLNERDKKAPSKDGAQRHGRYSYQIKQIFSLSSQL